VGLSLAEGLKGVLLLHVVQGLIVLQFFVLVVTRVDYHRRGGCVHDWLFWLLSFNPYILEHLREITLPIGPLFTRQYQPLSISLHPILFPDLLIKEPSDILVINRPQPLVHAAHHPYIVVVEYVDLLHVEEHRQVPLLVRKKKLGHGLRDESDRDVSGLRRDDLLDITLGFFHEGGSEGVFHGFFGFGGGTLGFHRDASLHEGLELGLEGFEGFKSEPEI